MMGKLFERISNRIKITTKSIRSDLHFSPHFALLRLGDELGGRLGFKRASAKAGSKKHQWAMEYLRANLAETIEQYRWDTDIGTYEPNAPVWICWWTGEETAPQLVKQCIKSIREHANGHPIHFITRDNYKDYLDIPEYILTKVEEGTMCVANFSDYLRFSLLAKYGGLWMDATIYCTQQLPENIFRMPVFTCKGRTGEGQYYSDYQWTAFCFGGYRGNVMFRFLQAVFDSYWKHHKVSLDYLLVDYLIKLVQCENETIRVLMEDIAVNNLHRDDLQAAMNAALPQDQWGQVIQPDTILYKLSWREKYREKTLYGEQTVYQYFIDQ